MRLQTILWRLCLLSGTAVGTRPQSLDLRAPQNTTSASAPSTTPTHSTGSSTVTDSEELCGIGGPGQSVTVPTNPPETACSGCITVSGVIVGTSVPTTLIDSNEVTLSSPLLDNKAAQLTHIPLATLMPRAPPKAVPLLEPGRNQGAFMEKLYNSIPGYPPLAIPIVPTPEQIEGWHIPLTIDGKTVSTPIGITGQWYPWESMPNNYKLMGMSGCTAVLIVGNKGFWAGHWWESSLPSNINGGSSHNYRYGSGKDDVKVRPLADFKTIATIPLGNPAPAAAAGSFVSLRDLQTIHGNPFSKTNGGADIYIITKAAGTSPAQQQEQRYADHIAALQEAIQKSITTTSVTMRTYIGDKSTFNEAIPPRNPAGVPILLNGVSILQYSPYAGEDEHGCPVARARVFEEVNQIPAVDRKWPAVGLNKRDGAACALKSTSLATSSPSATPTSPPPCLPFEDPDNGVEGLCQCNNGARIPMVTTLSTIGASVYTEQNCPWSTIPPQALTTAKPPATTNHAQYQFTYTNLNHQVIACETATPIDVIFDHSSIRECAGSTALLYQPPMATMEMGNSKVNVGTSMTGEALFTSVSNALTSLCPTPTSPGAWTSCQTGTINVGQATYLEGQTPEEGDLTIKVTDAQYNSTNYLDLFINMIAGAANASATGGNCKLLDWAVSYGKRDLSRRADIPPPPHEQEGSSTFCNMNSFLDTQWYDGVNEAAQMWFETEFGFDLGELGNFDCSSIVDTVGEVLGAIFDAIFPEFAWLIDTGVELGELACEAEETFNQKSRRAIEQEKAEAKLARAWKKEMKKDRKLPMPEHKKRELGLIDSLSG